MPDARVNGYGPVLDMFGQAAVLVQGGVVRHVNAAAKALLQDIAGQLLGVPLRALLDPDRAFDLATAEASHEVEIPWRSGAMPARIRCVDDDAHVIVVQQSARDSLGARMVDFADAAAEGILIADAVGGINDPLASLLMSLEEASHRMQLAPSEETQELLQLVEEGREAAQRVAGVVRNVLAVPRAPARTVPLDINELVERSARAVRRQRPTLQVQTELGGCTPVTAARERLEQVLVHVLLTAPTPTEGDCVRVRTCQQRDDVLIEMRGGGVAYDQLRAFERRYAVVTSLVQQMGGRCEPHLGEQHLTLRLSFGATASQGVELAASRGRRTDAPPRGELRILVVDDEPSIHRALRRALRDVGLVQAVSSGNAAIEMLRGGAQFDVVLCDVVMANGTGLDLADWLNRRGDPLKRRMILMTGMGESDNVSHPDVLTVSKPFDSAALRELVCQVATRS